METLEQRIRRVTRERVAVIPYDPSWPESFRRVAVNLCGNPFLVSAWDGWDSGGEGPNWAMKWKGLARR
jgi:hypothetical protein